MASVVVDAQHSVPVAVPRLCVLNIDLHPQTFIVDEHGVTHMRRIQLGVADADRVEILAGISAGDRCVVAGNQSLRDGMTVRVIKTEF
jgi:multidrug efflux pump subunit AcrA (membrane-fusion protein)